MNKDTTRKELRKFGIIFGTALIIMGYAIVPLVKYIFKMKVILRIWPLVTGISIIVLGIALPLSLKPLHFILRKILDVIKAIVTLPVLMFVFYLVLTPIGLIARLFGNDFLNMNWEKKSTTYWIKKEPSAEGVKKYEKQF